MSTNQSKLLLADERVKRWYDNVARGSDITADVYLRRLKSFSECMHIPLNDFAARNRDLDDIYDDILDFVSREEERGVSGTYIKSSLNAVKSWLTFNNKKITRPIKVRGSNDNPTLENERVPTAEELRKIFLSCTTRDRVFCALMAHSGLRPESLGNYRGTDGLRIKDLPEMTIKNKEIVFEKVPTMVVIRPELSKASHRYFSFLGEEGCAYLKSYLEERMRKGEFFSKETDLLSSKVEGKSFLSTKSVSKGLRTGIRKAGFPWRPYVLRAFFDTQMLLSESKGRIVRDFRAFFMGHKGDIEARYTTHKSKLPTELVENMRESYASSMKFLETMGKPPKDEESERTGFRKQMLTMLGMNEKEIKQMDLDNMDDSEIMALLKTKMAGMITGNGNNQKVVPLKDVEKYIIQGWEYVDELPGGKGIIRLPF